MTKYKNIRYKEKLQWAFSGKRQMVRCNENSMATTVTTQITKCS